MKKLAKKASKKTTNKPEVKRAVRAMVEKVTEKKKRGRKPGVKIGKYKKKKDLLITENLEQNVRTSDTNSANNSGSLNTNISNNSGGVQARAEQQAKNENKEVSNTVSSDSVNIGDIQNDKSIFDKFIEENRSREEYVEERLPEKPADNKSTYTPDNTTFSQSQRQLISGSMLIAFCDFIFPTVILKVMGYFDSNAKKVNKQLVKLTADQKKDLEPAADIVAAHVFQTANPMVIFFLAMTICYASNFMDASEEMKKRESEKPILETHQTKEIVQTTKTKPSKKK